MSTESIPRYPLAWPLGWTRCRSRRHGTFKKGGAWINVEHATKRLELELDRLGATNATLSTNVPLNLRGLPRGDQQPSDPGVAVYFGFKGRATVLACDSYWRVADNIAAIAAHVDALRRIDRYGVGTLEQALAGYKALPADSAADWRKVLFGERLPAPVTKDAVDRAVREMAKTRHPDVPGGSVEAMTQVNRAREFAYAEMGWK